MKLLSSNSANKMEWDNYLISIPTTTLFQSYNFAMLYKRILGLEPKFIKFISDDQETAGQILVLVGRNVPKLKGSILEKPILFITKKIVPFAYWLDGPVYSNAEDVPKMLDLLDDFCKRSKYSIRNATLPLGQENIASILTEKGYDVKIEYTLVINLKKTLDEAFSALTKKGRKAVREAQGRGVVVRRANSEKDIMEYYRLLSSWKKRLGQDTKMTYDDLKTQWNLLHRENQMEVFMAYWNSQLVAALGIIHFNGNLVEVMSAQSELNYHKNLFAGDLIKWSIIEWGVKKGMKTYDLGGVNPNPTASEKEKAIYQFKSKWGGELMGRLTISKNNSWVPFLKKI